MLNFKENRVKREATQGKAVQRRKKKKRGGSFTVAVHRDRREQKLDASVD